MMAQADDDLTALVKPTGSNAVAVAGYQYEGGHFVTAAPVDYWWHLRVDTGENAAFTLKSLYTMTAKVRSGPPDARQQVMKFTASALKTLDLAAGLQQAYRRSVASHTQSADAFGPDPEPEITQLELLTQAAQRAGQGIPSARVRLIVESYANHVSPSEHRPGVCRGYSRLAVIVEGEGTAPRGKFTITNLDGLAAISEADVFTAFAHAQASSRINACAEPLPPMTGPVLFSPQASAIVAHETIGHLAEADNFVAMPGGNRELGQIVGAEALSVSEHGHVPSQWGSVVVDDEGTVTRSVPVMQKGRLTGLLTSNRFASLSDDRSSGHARRGWHDALAVPRMGRLSLDPGSMLAASLGAGIGSHLKVESIRSGHMIPRTREVQLELGLSRLIDRDSETAAVYAGGTIKVRCEDLLSRCLAVAVDDHTWFPNMCFKQGHLQPVHDGAPSTLFDEVTVE